MNTLCSFERNDELSKPHYPDGAWQCTKCGAVSPFDSRRLCDVVGAGDDLEKLIHFLKLDKLFKKEGCMRCPKRKKWINKKISFYRRRVSNPNS